MPCAEIRELLEWAGIAVKKEIKQSPLDFDIDSEIKGYVKARHRDRSLSELLKLSNHFGFEPETFANAVILIDRFLGLVKVHPKYMRCISMAGLLISAKLTEEEEFVPSVTDFVQIGQCDCSVADLKRMEKLMADKLNWNLISVTPVQFLHKFLKLFINLGVIPESTYKSIGQRLQKPLLAMLCKKSICHHKGSTLVLGLIWYEIERLGIDQGNQVIDVARLLKVSDHEFMHCAGLVNDFIELSSSNNCAVSRKRKRSAMFSATNSLPTIVEATTAAESESESDDESEDSQSNDDDDYQDYEITNSEQHHTLESMDKQNYLASLELEEGTKPLYSTVVKTSCSTVVGCKENHTLFKEHQTLVY